MCLHLGLFVILLVLFILTEKIFYHLLILNLLLLLIFCSPLSSFNFHLNYFNLLLPTTFFLFKIELRQRRLLAHRIFLLSWFLFFDFFVFYYICVSLWKVLLVLEGKIIFLCLFLSIWFLSFMFVRLFHFACCCCRVYFFEWGAFLLFMVVGLWGFVRIFVGFLMGCFNVRFFVGRRILSL